MAKIPVSRAGRAYSKSSSDGFMAGGNGGKAGAALGEKLGRELVEDPKFYDPSRWTIGAEWTIGFGKAVGVPATSSAITQPTILLEEGEKYRVEVEVAANAGTVEVQFTSGTQVDGGPISEDSSFTMMAATGNENIAIRKAIDFDGEVTRLSVRKIIAQEI